MKQFLYYSVIFLFVFFCASQAQALTSGTTTTGTISIPGGISYQNFTASAGQSIALQGYSSAYNVAIKVLKPDGTVLGTGTHRYNATLPVSGTYSVEIYNVSSATGGYSLSYVQGGGSVSNGSLTSGQSFSGSLSQNGMDSYQFTGTSGEGFFLSAYAASYTAQIWIYKPDGSYWTYGNSNEYGTLPATGTYTVIVRTGTASGRGSYLLDYVLGAGSVSNGTL